MTISTKNPAEMTGQERMDEMTTLLAEAFLRRVRSEKDLTGHLRNSERSYGRPGVLTQGSRSGNPEVKGGTA